MLIGEGDAQLRTLLAQKYPTAGVVTIDFAAKRWRSIGPGSGKLRHFMGPKRLPE
jgi:hypothetical protein